MDKIHSHRTGGEGSHRPEPPDVGDNADLVRRLASRDVGQLQALRDLGTQLHVKAERMRLLARAEEGLGESGFNPYTTVTISPCTDRGDVACHLPEPAAQRTVTKEHVSSEAQPNKGSKKKQRTIVSRVKQQSSKKADPKKDSPSTSKIPVSSARQRRRSRNTKTKSSHVSSVNIHQYRPGYTWNMGGRLKELRIRNLARKFSTIWKRKVFGRVTPSQARRHYQMTVLKTTFGAWYDLWWEARKEWRLMIRAECHHRHVLWVKTFRAWRDYVIKRRVHHTKMTLAKQHGSCRLVRKCLESWIVYTDMRRHKKRKVAAADNFHYMSMLRLYWGRWTGEHDLVHHRQHMETVALQFWAYRLQAQHWLVWQERLSSRRSAVMKQYRAVRHYSGHLLRKCFQGWLVYCARRRHKSHKKDYGTSLYQQSLCQKAFRQWRAAYRLRLAEHEHQGHMEHLAHRFTLRRAFAHWQHYIVLVHEEHEMIAEAENHYIRKLLAAGLSAFRLNVVQIRIKAMRHELAAQFRYKQLQKWAWNHWLGRCDNNEELRMIGQTRRAWKHYQMTLLGKCLAQLQQYCFWRQHRKAQYARADAHYYMHTVPEYLFTMRIFVQLMKNNRENQENAVAFRSENLQARFFYAWCSSFEFSKEYRMNERMAILHHEQSCVKSFFHLWRQETSLALREKDNEELASEHYCMDLCRSHLRAWKAYVDDIKQSQRDEIKAARHYCVKKMKRCLVAWRNYTRERKRKQEKTRKARTHYGQKLCKRMILMWAHYVDMQRAIKQQAEAKYKVKCQQLLRSAFHTWRENVADQIADRHADRHADIHRSHHIMSKIVVAWHRYAAIHAYKKQETRQWVESATEHMNRVRLSIYFNKWRRYHTERLTNHAKCLAADQHHAGKVKAKVMDVWKTFTKESIKKSLLRKQSEWFCSVRLTARYFITWKHAYTESQTVMEKTNLALWHWCLNLHRKVLIGWYTYVQQRKHKKAQVMAAMERRRVRLLRDGVKQWLTVAGDMSAMRARFAAQQQAKSAHETYQLVLRCGLHWKHWAAKQRESRGGRPLARPLPKSVATNPRADTSTPRDTNTQHYVIPKPRDTVRAISPKMPGHVTSVTPISAVNSTREVIPPVKCVNVPEVHAHPQLRARPRRPDFLVESLKRAGLYSSSLYGQGQEEGSRSESNVYMAPKSGNTPTDMDRFQIERLNLSNISENKSESETHRTKLTSDTDHSQIQQTTTNGHVHDWSKNMEPGPIETDRSREPSHQTLPSDRSESHHIQSMQRQSKSSKPVPTYVKLMTPADFLGKQTNPAISDRKSTNEQYSSAVPNVNNAFVHDTSVCSEKLSQRLSVLAENFNIHSEPQSVASTPRVLCQSSDHFHPLSQTYSSNTGELPRWVTPQEVATDIPRLVEENTTDKITKTDVQKEIVRIRNQLKTFEQKKKKLRTMQKQLKQLSDWLREQEVEGEGHGSDDEDVENTMREVKELSADVSVLKETVDSEKARCSRLVDRVKVLVSQLAT